MAVLRKGLTGIPAVLVAGLLSAAAPADPPGERCPGHRDDPRVHVVGTDDDDILSVPAGAVGCGLGGDDILEAEADGGTSLYGGPGDDVLCARNLDPDRVYGGSGRDRAKVDDEDAVRDVEGDVVVVACHRT